ncbi:hypothetical protein ABT116_35580, partial [Streptomyces sp. NPDC002130]|uniref:hypothetical protein n=1 Tax=Streptomyces sp. NPDC002130 TaxID=3155568 RepID=UPI0033252BAA
MSTGPRRTLRLLPWTGIEAKPCFLITDGGGGRLSRLADIAEATQLDMSAQLLAHGEDLLPGATQTQLRFLAERLTEALRDVLRVAESRGEAHGDGPSDSFAPRDPPTASTPSAPSPPAPATRTSTPFEPWLRAPSCSSACYPPDLLPCAGAT